MTKPSLLDRNSASEVNPLIRDNLQETTKAAADVINLLACATADANHRGFPTGDGLCWVLEVVHAALKFEIAESEQADPGASATTLHPTPDVVAAETQGGRDHV